MGTIEGALAVIKQLIDLIKRREKREETTFKKFVEDLYAQFEPVGQNYIRLFEDLGTRAAGATSTKAFDDVFTRFEEERKEYEFLRGKIADLARSYSKAENFRNEVRDFFALMVDFFYDGGSGASMSRQLQERFHTLIEARRVIASRRLRIDEELAMAEFGSPTRGAGKGSEGVGSFEARLRLKKRRESYARLDEEEKRNRDECVREAQAQTDRCKIVSRDINRLYAELKVKYLLH